MKLNRKFTHILQAFFVGILILSIVVVGPVSAASGPDLVVGKVQNGVFTQGDVGVTYSITVTNLGDTPTSGAIYVKIYPDVPAGLTATGMSGVGWTCDVNILECMRNDAIGVGAGFAPITLTVDVALDAPSQVITPVVVEGGGEPVDNHGNNEANSPTDIIQIPDLVISKSHTDDFSQGDQDRTYTIIVTNSGYASTDGTLVTVTDNLPTGLTAKYLEGDNWDCDISTLTCTRIGVLPVGESYDTITLTVKVDYDAPSNITNTAIVSGGGERDVSNNVSEDLTTITQKSDLIITNVTVSPVSLEPGEPFDINVTVKNQGSVVTESIVYRDVYINKNPSDFIDAESGCPIDEGDYYRSDYNDGLPPDAVDTKPVSVADGLDTGRYQIWVYVDATCINQESVETNNVYGPINITVGKVNTFEDVPVDAFAWAQIESIYAAGITGGCSASPLNYCPNNPVTRAQMAVFLLRGIYGSSYTPPPATGVVFSDVPINAFAAGWIEQMITDGITAGCGGGNFCPNGLVTRAQMAVFLLRAKHGSGYTPPSATGSIFSDVPINGFAASWIEQLVDEGITSGCGGGNFCPGQAVTRAQMAVFLQRTFGLSLP